MIFTNGRPNNQILGVQAYSSDAYDGRKATFLTEGIFNYKSTSSCSVLKENINVYMRFNFKKQTKVSKIIIRTQYYEALTHMPSVKTNIILGNSSSSLENFSNNLIIGKFDNAQINEERVFHINPPMLAKFLAIQQVNANQLLAICFIEVFE